MIFALRGIAVWFSISFIAYTALSLAVSFTFRCSPGLFADMSPARRANWVFVIRILPLALALGFTLVFAVPSFLLLEPHAVREPLGIGIVLLGLCGVAVVLHGLWSATSALVHVAKTVAIWSQEAELMQDNPCGLLPGIPVLRTSALAPPLSTVGILRPRIWLSTAADIELAGGELSAALRHEVEHVRRRDNLKKLMLRTVQFPGMARLEREWREASEMAADEAVVSSPSEALDLATAVIKLSSLLPRRPPVELTTALVHSPAESLNARVERLVAWTEPRRELPHGYDWICWLFSAAGASVMFAAYGDLLVKVHAATEWLVR
jgi:hypothetical protein